VLTLRGIRKRYGTALILNDVAADVVEGERVGIRGRNGAGKSTLFRILTRATPADAGDVIFNGDNLLNCAPGELRVRGVAHIAQQPKLISNLSVAANVELGSYFLTQGRFGTLFPTRENSADALHAVGAAHLRERVTENLSRYEIRLVELARFATHMPKLLLLDEPAAGLTRREKDHLIGLLQDLVPRTTTMLLIEHDPAFVAATCDRVLSLIDGRLSET